MTIIHYWSRKTKFVCPWLVTNYIYPTQMFSYCTHMTDVVHNVWYLIIFVSTCIYYLMLSTPEIAWVYLVEILSKGCRYASSCWMAAGHKYCFFRIPSRNVTWNPFGLSVSSKDEHGSMLSLNMGSKNCAGLLARRGHHLAIFLIQNKILHERADR